jgi:hypothetical protein
VFLFYRKEKGRAMIKSLGVLIGGVFIGAVGVEVFRKKCPKALDKLYSKTCNVTSGAKEAFKKGYANAVQPKQAAQAGA